jgi:hypothetical protein
MTKAIRRRYGAQRREPEEGDGDGVLIASLTAVGQLHSLLLVPSFE